MKQFVLLLLLALIPFAIEAKESDKDLDVKQIVIDHLGDDYEWHITSVGDRKIVVPLPIIVHSPKTGWHVFLSKNLRDGAEYEGMRIAKDGEHAGKIVERQADGTDLKPFDISISKSVAGLLINSLVVIWLILGVAHYYRKHKVDDAAPRGFVGLMEMAIEAIVNTVIKPCVGPNYRKYTPFLLTLFFFILINNFMGLIPIFPGGANVTGNIAVTAVLALITFFVVNLNGSKHYWKDIFWPDVPLLLKFPIPIIPIIEFVGILTKPFALMIRLFANMMAGHAVILSLMCVIFVTVKMGAAVNGSMSVMSVCFSIFMNCLEILVAFLQAYIFTMLAAVFIGQAQDEESGETEKVKNN